jgi:hypothetical protein
MDFSAKLENLQAKANATVATVRAAARRTATTSLLDPKDREVMQNPGWHARGLGCGPADLPRSARSPRVRRTPSCRLLSPTADCECYQRVGPPVRPLTRAIPQL